MTPEQWKRVRTLFDVAGGLPEHQRAAFLRHACAEEPALRGEVESLLVAAEGAADFLEKGALEQATWPHELTCEAPWRSRIGPYEVIGVLGSGGMGTVYLARRSDGGFQQEVAIKLVRGGMADELVLRRFVAERQILAGLVHPFIARLYDGGTTEDGLPYFVMEHVEGEDLLLACDRRRLSTADRLRLFVKVCEAVQYAHQRLVVHRDLKPGNILVTADGTPKLLDFGVAKLLQPDGPSAGGEAPTAPQPTELTVLGGRVMTPEYASPEQVRGEPVTTASDVYSLGVLLYELLTGHRPYELTSRRAEDVERVICDTDPPRPSTVVGRTPARLRKSLAGDLDTIVMTALRKEPERRYGSVEQLAEDLRRHLAGLPVSARPDTFAYRTGKLLRRHAWAVATTALVVATLATLVTFYTLRLAAERDRARLEAAKAQRLSAFLANLFELSDLDRTQGEKLGVRDIVDRGAKNLERDLGDEPEVAATLMGLIGRVYAQLDLKAQARPLLEGALANRRRLHGSDDPRSLAAERELAALYLESEQPARAEPLLRHVLAVEERRSGADAAVAETLTLLSLLHKRRGDYGAAEEVLSRAAILQEHVGPRAELPLAATLISHGHLLLSVDEPARALPLLQHAHAIRERQLGRDSPATVASLLDVAACQRDLGQLDAAIAAEERVLAASERAYGQGHSMTAYGQGELAMSHAARGDVARARELYGRAIATFTALAGADAHPTLVYRKGLGQLLLASGDPRGALRELDGVRRAYERTLGREHPRVGMVLFDLAQAHLALGEQAAAEQAMRRGLAILRRELRPDSRRLGQALASLGELLCGETRAGEGAPLLREAIEVLEGAQPETAADVEAASAALAVCAP
jgi:serine/threonine-protein kinase